MKCDKETDLNRPRRAMAAVRRSHFSPRVWPYVTLARHSMITLMIDRNAT
jgi:hypothetical protein